MRPIKFLSGMVCLGVVAAVAATGLAIPPAHAGNIIGIANDANACGGATLCSTNTGPLPTGTQGYVETGSTPFDLSTINQWFQIDTTTPAVSHLANQPPEPLGGAGNFLVINDTGSTVTSFSLTINDTYGAAGCSGSPADMCNFQIHATTAGGGTIGFATGTLTGADCVSGCGTASADFTPGTVTYNWSGGPGIAAGAKFDLNFASWNNDVFSVPAPLIGRGLPVLLAVGGLLFGARLLERSKKRRSLGTAISHAAA
jgi:hypothetical protein